MLIALVGGIGLFLLGIHLLTEGIRSMSEDALRSVLQRFTSTRARAFLSGFSVTAVIQSANATIIMTMGFVAAGLLALPLSIAVVIGANVGTTSTAWIVAVLGLRFSLVPWAMGAVLVGAVLRLFDWRRGGPIGTALAGFGLLLLGIDFMREGMADVAPGLQAALPDAGIGAVLSLILIGIVATAAAQSSSVAITATMTALAVGGVGLDQAALLTIGHNLGTLVTAFLAALGAGAGGRRAAIAHALFNGAAAVACLLAFTPFLIASERFSDWIGGGDAIALASFHTLFNIAGAAILLPATGLVAARVARWVPEEEGALARNLDPLASQLPAAALEATRLALAEVTERTVGVLLSRIQHGELSRGTERRLVGAEKGADRIRLFMERLDTPAGRGSPAYERAVRTLDHLEGLLAGARATDLRVAAFQAKPVLAPATRLREGLDEAGTWLRGGLEGAPDAALSALDGVPEMGDLRREILAATGVGDTDLLEGMAQLDALHWVAEQATHMTRILHHLADQR